MPHDSPLHQVFTIENAENLPKEEVQARLLEKMKQLVEQQEHSSKLLIRRDLELSRANEQLRELDQMKSDFISVATHQMRTPLSGIRWTLSMMLKGDLGVLTDAQKDFMTKAYDSNERMIALINDMLISHRLDSGKFVVTDEATYAVDLIESVFSDVTPAAIRRKVKLSFVHPEEKYPPVKIAPEHLRAVTQNLLENAIKYSRPEGTVTVSLSQHEGMMQISVADQGIGIPANQQDKVFSRFFRAPNAVKMETDGTGLGLFIIKSIVEKHLGKVRFETTENVGTTFYIELPVADHV